MLMACLSPQGRHGSVLLRLNDLLKVTEPGSVMTKIPQAICKAHCAALPLNGDAFCGQRQVHSRQRGELTPKNDDNIAGRIRALVLLYKNCFSPSIPEY